ncbi:solute carrier family 22 member 1-like [Hyposmocoma kahamanoa]|uniref:solute carrier family 22 member 1-like n=1 Tax=Hyposmocoma kahamanoa TaxID=1477025 RepID=UPI000E6D7A7A|nr:solute carrier family 22 member 1-like [Hyposmocoma kahamanoa]
MTEFNDDEKKVHVDDVLEKLGAFGKHQLITMCMLALVYSTNSMYNVNYVFAVEDVGYRCKIPSCDESTPNFTTSWLIDAFPDVSDVTIKQCSHYQMLNQNGRECSFNKTSVPLECTDFVYEIPNSFVAEFGLACQDWKQAMVGTVHSFGNMIGLLVQGQISDRWGRKTAAVFAGTMGAILGISKSFAPSFWFYIVLEGLEAAIGDALSPMFMLSIEIVEKKRTVLFQMILLNCYTCGLIIMPFIAWAVPYWRNFLRVLYAPTLLILTYSFFLDESIRWLFSKGKRERGTKLIQKIANRNGVQLDKAMLNKLEYIGEDASNVINDRQLLLKTFKSKIMMQRFLVCLVWWFTITLINYGMMIGSVFIEGNKYINFALLMLMDIPSNVFYWLAMSKYKRKLPLICSFIVGGIFCLLQPFTPKGYAWLGLLLFMAFETLATFSYNIVYIYTSELFPTYTRNSMHAICSAMGRVGSLIAPQTPLLLSYWSGLPSLLFGLTSLLCGVLTLFIPETANCELPDTVQEAERIGKKKQIKEFTLLASENKRTDTGDPLLNEHCNETT